MYIKRFENNYYFIECERCGALIKKHKTYAKEYGDEIHFNPTVTCQCGNTSRVFTNGNTEEIDKPDEIYEIKVCCPHCGSIQIAAINKGFSVGKAAVGVALFGVIGALGGALGSNKPMVVCLKCGYKWEAGK